MRPLLFDADVPLPVVAAVEALRVPATSVGRLAKGGSSDEEILDLAARLDAILVTIDRDFTNQPLFAAMVARGSRVVRLRLPPGTPAAQLNEQLTMLILQNYREWQKLLDPEPGLVSCTSRGNRLRKLTEFPWYGR